MGTLLVVSALWSLQQKERPTNRARTKSQRQAKTARAGKRLADRRCTRQKSASQIRKQGNRQGRTQDSLQMQRPRPPRPAPLGAFGGRLVVRRSLPRWLNLFRLLLHLQSLHARQSPIPRLPVS